MHMYDEGLVPLGGKDLVFMRLRQNIYCIIVICYEEQKHSNLSNLPILCILTTRDPPVTLQNHGP